MCHVDSKQKLIVYGDSLGWAMPSELLLKVRQFIDAVYGEESQTYALHTCHDPNSKAWSGNHQCCDQCAASHSRDAVTCGMVSMIMVALTCHLPNYFQSLVTRYSKAKNVLMMLA